MRPFRRVLSKLAKTAYTALSVLGALVAVATFTPLVTWWGGWLAGPWNDPQGKILIVLGGSTMGDSLLGESSYWRAVYAVRAWKAGKFQSIVVSGRGAAEPMRTFLEANGIPASAIMLEPRSESTRQNALYVKELLNGERMPVLLTSDYHMFRAERAFKKAGLAVLPHPFPDARKRGGRWISRWSAFIDLVSETGKIGYYLLRGWI